MLINPSLIGVTEFPSLFPFDIYQSSAKKEKKENRDLSPNGGGEGEASTKDLTKGVARPKFTKESKSPPDVKRLKKIVSDSLSSNPLFLDVC